ncbi:hypothetical protein ISCGN_008521 [Ixodes scapularis]
MDPKLPGSLVKIDHATSIPIEGIRRYGVDALLHVELVHNSAANSSYDFDLPIPAHSFVDVAIGVPDMGDLEYTELLDSGNVKLDAWVKSTYPALNDEPFTGETIVKFYASFVKFMAMCREADFNMAPQIWTEEELEGVPTTTTNLLNWRKFIDAVTHPIKVKRYIVMSPTWIREFPLFLKKEIDEKRVNIAVFAYVLKMDLGARVMPTLVLPAGTNERLREYWCIRWVDSMTPGLASIPLADVLQKRWTNSLGKPPTAVPGL